MSTSGYHTSPLAAVSAEFERPSIQPPRALLALSMTGLLGFASVLAWGWQPSLLFQPTVVGVLWAGLFLAGYLLGGVGRGRLASLCLAAPLAYCSWRAFQSLTDLGSADSLLLAGVLLSGGWGATAAGDFPPCRFAADGDGRLLRGKCTIWDIGLAMTLAACIARAAPRLETPLPLMFAVAIALLSGLLCSWIACTWVWRDRWDWKSLCGLGVTLAVGMALMVASSPPGLSFVHAVSWGLAGPINVTAAQGTTVLIIVGLWRWESDRLQPWAAR